jgi:predicted permease
MRTIARSLQIRYPQTNTNRDVHVIPEAERAVAGSRQALWILFVSMLFLLLVACTNIGALTLSRAMSRRQDMAIRMALGASRGDILRPVIIECSSLAIAGSVLGSLVGIWAANAIVQLLSEMFPHLPEQFHFSAAVLAFSAALCAATIFMAIAPILRTSSGPLSVNARTIVGEGSGASIRGALIAAQVALTLCLLIGASLLMQSLLHLMQTPLGVDTHNALIFEVRAPVVRYSFAKQAIFFRDLTTSLSQIPGVRSATAGEPLPLSRVYTSTRVRLDDNASVDPPAAEFHDVMPNYFETLRIPLIKGRAFGPQDTLTSAPVVIVSESFARANFPAGDALGKRVRVALGLDPPLREIVGIVGDVRQKNIMTAPQPAIYMAHAQFPFSVMSVIMKTNSDPLRFVNASRTVLRGMDQDVAVGSPTRLENVVSGGISLQRITAVVSAVICALALALTGMGLYGIIAYQMQRRAREIGVRIALGAEPLDVLWLSVRRALVLSSIGILCGFAIIWELYPALEGFLYTVSPRDPIILAAAPLFLLAVAAIAGLVPGLRALRCNVSNVLRAD